MLSNPQLEQFSLDGKREIGEDTANIKEALGALQNVLIENYDSPKLPPNPADFLLRFLRASKFDIPKAAKRVSQYFRLLEQLSDIHHMFLPSSGGVDGILTDLGLAVLKERDSKGRIVILFRQERNPPTAEWLDLVSVALFLLLDHLLRTSVESQRIGVVLLFDFQGYSLDHVRNMSPFRVIKYTKLIAQAFPARIKGLHYVRNPGIFGALIAIFKPVLPTKLKSRLHVHGLDFESLHERIEPDILPKFLGGQLPHDEYADLQVISELKEDEKYFKELLSCGYAEKEE